MNKPSWKALCTLANQLVHRSNSVLQCQFFLNPTCTLSIVFMNTAFFQELVHLGSIQELTSSMNLEEEF